MQARLEIRRFPATFVAFVLGLAAALLIGGSLGYVLKPTTTVPGPTHTVVISSGQVDYAAGIWDNCVWSGHQKSC